MHLHAFSLPTRLTEEGFYLNARQLDMQCYDDTVYPFKIFPEKELTRLEFEPFTVFYGGNGSGKSTLLNVIGEKLSLPRTAPFNRSACFDAYLERCYAQTEKALPPHSRLVSSDDVFDFLLNVRAINEGIADRRRTLFDEYHAAKYSRGQSGYRMRSLADYEELCRRNEIRHSTKSAYTTRRLPPELAGKSNGESAYAYFTEMIAPGSLVLLDEPENSLSAALQRDLASYLSDSVRFYGCQFVIATHSPFLLSLPGVRIYDLDSVPVTPKKWTELANMRLYAELFLAHGDGFQ